MSSRKMAPLSLAFILLGLFHPMPCEQHAGPNSSNSSILPMSADLTHFHEVFSQEMLRIMLEENPESNFVFSPISISTALILIARGTRSNTFFNLLDALGYDLKVADPDIVEKFLLGVLQKLNGMQKKKFLRHRNFLFINSHRTIEPAFMKDMYTYNAKVHKIDFQDTGKATVDMKEVVPEKIKERFHDIITPVDPKTFMLLVNYIFFRHRNFCNSSHFGSSSSPHFLNEFQKEGSCNGNFHTDITQKETFFVNKFKSVHVEMMMKTDRMIYSRWDELLATTVELPYNEHLSLVLVLPDEGEFSATQSRMDFKRDRLSHHRDTRLVSLMIPKFKVSYKINLRHLLPKLGIKDMFSTTANFSYITKDVFPVYFEGTHAASIEMNQNNTMTPRDLARDRKKRDIQERDSIEATVVKVNRPFFLFVMDCKNETEIMVARVFNPTDE
ncbi:uteroferrin-associated basic protein 2-like [Sorex fumeus]|uniref:uteroferrin-associated basic protein 2-like n=1 Tax=Sorex fumeus TaxID=62283 RepID=UPI0024AE1F2A|nr:uteroferrin-associated basic protein 2-like [Sorex fumeus]